LDATQATSIAISLIYTVFQVLIALFLFQRMRAARVKELRFVFLAFTFAALAGVLGIAWTGFRIVLNPPVAVFILPFVQATFFRNKASKYRLLLAVSIALLVYVLVARLASEFLEQGQSHDILYYSYIVAILAIFILCYGWFLVECATTYRKIATSRGIEPWVKFRYVLLGVSCAFAITTAVFPLAYPSHESFHEQAAVMKMVMAVSNLLFSITSFGAWFMPTRFKRYLNNLDQNHIELTDGPTTMATGSGVSEKLGSALLMSIIDHLGNRLAPRINKSTGAVKGLLLVSIEAAEKLRGVNGIDFAILHDAIVEEVSKRLGQLGVQNIPSPTTSSTSSPCSSWVSSELKSRSRADSLTDPRDGDRSRAAR
jgi:hypothetical protein